jgi:hemolysin activation/secretion protein
MASRQLVHLADRALPVYEKPFLGGPLTLRGHPVAFDAGDNLLLVSLESRHPLARKYALLNYGLYTFLDGGSVYDHSEGIEKASFRWGTGAGAYLNIFSYVFKVDVGWDLDENVAFTLTTGYHF